MRVSMYICENETVSVYARVSMYICENESVSVYAC